MELFTILGYTFTVFLKTEDMELNALKTKVMLFGDTVNKVSVKINDKVLECVTSFKYLSVFLDTQMDFSLQVDYAALKAKREMAKVGTLINVRKGIPIHIGIDLYKALVRPHLQFQCGQALQTSKSINSRVFRFSV